MFRRCPVAFRRGCSFGESTTLRFNTRHASTNPIRKRSNSELRRPTQGSGEDAILDEDDAVYKEGVRDRRTVFDFRGTPRPRYGAYAIYANTVLLCEGKDDGESWDRCAAVIQALENR